MEDLKLALVGYLNTKPFEYGLKTSKNRNQYSIYYDTPAKCVSLYQSDKVDVALVPVGALPEIKDYNIITDTCIGCVDHVRTVVLMSNEPIENCNHVILDSHSRSSALLTQILCKEYWGISPVYETKVISDVKHLDNKQAVLMIGDKVFTNEKKYKYSYDLGHYWLKLTGLSFAYAVWIAKSNVSQSSIDRLQLDLRSGINHIDKVIIEQENSNSIINLEEYYTKHIDYEYDVDKQKALSLYLQKVKLLELVY